LASEENPLANDPTPLHVNVLSDFLGAGKTTLLNHVPYHDKSVSRDTVLRSSLLGEYVAIGWFGYAVFGVLLWSLFVLQNPLSLVVVGSGLWIAFRVSGVCPGRFWAFLISGLWLLAVGALATAGIKNLPAWMSTGAQSPPVWTGLMACICVLDYLDWQLAARSGRSAEENRKVIRLHLLIAIAGLVLAWSIALPFGSLLYQWGNPPISGKFRKEELGLVGNIGFRFCEAFFTFWFFVIGANIGSFLNVVIWRMPNGKSIVYQKSSCPVCGSNILGRDNIPILGWLGLGGRCRSCNVEISARYPIVEAIVGCVFLVLYFVELLTGGINLPNRSVNQYAGVLWIILYTKWDLLGLYIFHCFLFCTLLTWMLMTKDGNRIPSRLILFSFAIAILAPIAFPNLCLVPLWKPLPAWLSGWVGIALHGVIGSIAGTIAGFVAGRFSRLVFKSVDSPERILALCTAIAGCVLGWQAAIAISAIFMMLALLTALSLSPGKVATKSSWILMGVLFVAVLVHHLTWRLQWSVFFS